MAQSETSHPKSRSKTAHWVRQRHRNIGARKFLLFRSDQLARFRNEIERSRSQPTMCHPVHATHGGACYPAICAPSRHVHRNKESRFGCLSRILRSEQLLCSDLREAFAGCGLAGRLGEFLPATQFLASNFEVAQAPWPSRL